MLTTTNLLLFRALFFCIYGTIGIMSPFLILYLKSGVGLSDREVALLTSLAGVTVILFQQMWGYAADVLAPKKWLIAVATLFSGGLFYEIGTLTHEWTIALVLFAFYTLYMCISQLLHGLLFAHLHSEKYFGVLRAWGSLGFVVMNMLVGIYADKVAGGNLRFIFPCFLGLTVICFFLVMPIPEARSIRTERLSFWRVQHHFLHRPEVLLFLFITFLYQAAHAPSYLFQAILMNNMGADRATIAYSYSLAAVLELPVFFIATRLIDRWGEHLLLLICCVVQTLRWVLVWSCTNPYQVIATSTLHCITFALYFAAAVSYMNHHAGPHLKASAQTMYALVYQGIASLAGNAIGAQAVSGSTLTPVTRWLAHDLLRLPDRGDIPNLFIACSVVAAISVLLALVLWRLEPRARIADLLATP